MSDPGRVEQGRRRILVVDDEPIISDSIATRLRAEGFDVDIAADGPSAVAATERLVPDLVVLDVMLPGFDGLEVCRRIQADRPVPVLMVTARVDETDMLIGLGVGADDYLIKPFSMRELVARVHALLRRSDRGAAAAAADVMRVGDVRIDVQERRVQRGESEIHLTRTEFDLLLFLAERPRAVVARETLLEHVWGWGSAGESRTVDSHVKALRRKLGGDLIRTVHGVGYALELPR
jgi:DNA-binding response OmpR family regulator